MDRRRFLGRSAVALLGLFGRTPEWLRAGTPPVPRKLDRIGLQLYTVRSLMQEDFEGTLEKVAGAGYKEVEFAGYYERNPMQIRSLLERLGLTAPATHISLNRVRDEMDQLIELSGTIGHRYLIVPSLPREERTSLDSYTKIAKFFNQVGEQCRKAGLRFAYHNHAFEFEAINGRVPYDVLLQETNPEAVEMELDLFWIIKGGQEPLRYFERFPGRFTLCHVKDMDRDGNMVDVGSGAIDFAGIFARSELAGLKHYFVEHDRPDSPAESIRNSYSHLEKLRF